MIWMFSKMCLLVWEASERTGIGLGRLGPYVFGGMIGRWPRKVSGNARR